jgi:hypothetical protein
MKVVRQLSIFLENKPGVLARLCATFSKEDVNIEGLSISDTIDHAVVRLITSKPTRARTILESAGVLVVETNVLLLRLPDKPGQLSQAAGRLAKAKVNIEYAYGTTDAPGGNLVLRVSDTRKAMKVLKSLKA